MVDPAFERGVGGGVGATIWDFQINRFWLEYFEKKLNFG